MWDSFHSKESQPFVNQISEIDWGVKLWRNFSALKIHWFRELFWKVRRGRSYPGVLLWICLGKNNSYTRERTKGSHTITPFKKNSGNSLNMYIYIYDYVYIYKYMPIQTAFVSEAGCKTDTFSSTAWANLFHHMFSWRELIAWIMAHRTNSYWAMDSCWSWLALIAISRETWEHPKA